MLRAIDRVCGWLMILGSCGHTAGTLAGYPFMSQIFVWSLGTSLAGFLLGVLNIVRAGRSSDRTLAAITTAGTCCWVLVALGFGKSINHFLDPRVAGNLAIAGALLVFCGVTLHRTNRPLSNAGAA